MSAEPTDIVEQLRREAEERRVAEESLRASEERFRVAFEEAPMGMVIGVGTGIITRVNRALCQMSDYTPEEMTGRHVREFMHPDDRDLTLSQVNQLMAGEIASFTIERRYLAKGGRIFWARATTTSVRNSDGIPAFVLGIIEDITSRKEAEEGLRQSLDQLRTIYDGMIEGLLITDIETTRFVRANGSMCRMLGYTEDELLGLSVADIHPREAVPDDLQRFQASAEGKRWINEDRPVLRRDGTIFYADITGHRIDYEGRPCLLALFRDVTERRQAQAVLRKERRALEHMLRASDHERQLIAYDIHDGLAQLLAGSIMQFQAFQQQKDRDPRQAATAFDAALAMLRQSHAEARRLISGVRPPILDESGVVAAIAHLVHEEKYDVGPRVEFRSRVAFKRLAPVLENSIYRIVQEGLTNAWKHSESPKVRIALLQRHDQVRIEIRDWGRGFDDDEVGTDCFGLDGIRERARLLGGRCIVKSVPGKGTRIVVELPLVARPE